MKYLLLLISLCGCTSAEFVSRQNHPFKGGVVRYLNAGASSIIESRRKDAISKINQYCGHSDFTIIRESADSSLTSYYTSYSSNAAMSFPISSDYLHIAFSCEIIHKISKEEILEKAKKCQSKGGIWINDTCQIDLD